MWFLKPKHTVESVARRLVEGLENGTIVLGWEEKPTQQEPPPNPAPEIGKAGPDGSDSSAPNCPVGVAHDHS